MSRITRRELILGGAGATILGVTAAHSENVMAAPRPTAQVGKVDPLGEGIYFHQGNILIGHCNNGWIFFEDYVLVIDANFPSGARDVIPKIRALTDKPIRFAFDTHHHGDHAYGNQVWVENGATPIAHTGVIEEMKRYETGYYGNTPGRWEDAAKGREDVRSSKLKPPSVLFPRDLIFDDGKHRVELMHLGIAHTHGDAFAWLPNEKILFTGDACVNGAFNYLDDGDTEKWIATLDAARKLGARVICPGHGPRGAADVLADQQMFFQQLRKQVGGLLTAKKSPEEIRSSIEQIGAALKTNKQIERYVGVSLPAQVEKVYTELSGKKLPSAQRVSIDARRRHAHQHGHVLQHV
jgi:cyclase